MHVVQLAGAGDEVRIILHAGAACEQLAGEAGLDHDGVLRAGHQGHRVRFLGGGPGGAVRILDGHGEVASAQGNVLPAALGIGRQDAVRPEDDVLELDRDVLLAEPVQEDPHRVGDAGGQSEDELHDAAPVQGGAGVFGHPGVREGDFRKVCLGDAAQFGREDQMVRTAVAHLGERRIAGLGFLRGGIGARANDVKAAAGHFGAGETGPMVREPGLDVVHGRGAAADDADTVALLPGQVKPRLAFGHGKACSRNRLFRQRGADGHHGALSGGRILLANASRQDGKGQSQR